MNSRYIYLLFVFNLFINQCLSQSDFIVKGEFQIIGENYGAFHVVCKILLDEKESQYSKEFSTKSPHTLKARIQPALSFSKVNVRFEVLEPGHCLFIDSLEKIPITSDQMWKMRVKTFNKMKEEASSLEHSSDFDLNYQELKRIALINSRSWKELYNIFAIHLNSRTKPADQNEIIFDIFKLITISQLSDDTKISLFSMCIANFTKMASDSKLSLPLFICKNAIQKKNWIFFVRKINIVFCGDIHLGADKLTPELVESQCADIKDYLKTHVICP